MTRKSHATVTATSPLRCFVLTRGRFLHVLNDMPDVERKVMRMTWPNVSPTSILVAASNDPSL